MSSHSRGAVAAGHPVTAEAAASILRDGGNAFDGALAAMCTACVVEPVLASLGGAGFLTAHTATGGEHVFDFSTSTPLQHRNTEELDFYPIDVNFGSATQEFHIGMGSIAVPGAIRGLFDVHRNLGKLPLSRIIEPALVAGRQGVPVNKLQGVILDIISPIQMATEGSRALYGGAGGQVVREGEQLGNAEFADVLEALAREGDDLFYQGELGKRLVQDCQALGGQVTMDDLGCYQTRQRPPFEHHYRGTRVLTNPPPSSGGLLIAFGLQLLEAENLQRDGWGSPQHLGSLASALGLTAKARIDARLTGILGEPGGQDDPATRLYDPNALDLYRRELLGRPAANSGTTHLNVVDAEGNIAAMTLSNGQGCGYILPGTGIMMNNFLGEEDLNPQGFHCWDPGCRITSMMAPTVLLWPDGSSAALGSGGSNRIRTAILQAIVNLVDFGMTAQQATNAPRIHTTGQLLDIEAGYPDAGAKAAEAQCSDRLDWPEPNLYFGGVHLVTRSASGVMDGGGDPRRGGVFLPV